jgi:23S rRNA pseudouridine1911/1915/1917 synthase
MPSKNMLPKGDRRKSVKAEYRAQRTLAQERAAALRESGEAADKVAAPRSHSTAQSEEAPPVKSPWAHNPSLVTSGPESGKMPPEYDTQSTRRYASPYAAAPERPDIQVLEDLEPEDGVRAFTAEPAAKGVRLDAYLAKAIPDISRARVVLLIENGQVTVDAKPGKASHKLKGGELIEIEGDPQPQPLNATPEDIPLTIVYEDADLAVLDKPAGMMVHAGSGAPEHNRGTLVNALLFHLGKGLSPQLNARRRAAPRHRPPAGQADQRPHRRRQERPHASQARRDVQRAPPAQELPRAGARLARAGLRHHLAAHQPRRHPPHPHDHAPRRRPHRGLALAGAGAHRWPLRKVHAALRAH